MVAKTGTASQSKPSKSTAGKTLSKPTSSSGGGGGGLFKTITGYNNPVDMINGGGRGQAGSTFQGHAASGILNALGVKPMGSGSTMGGGGGADSGQAAARRDAAARYPSGAGRGDGGGGGGGPIFDAIIRRVRRGGASATPASATLASIGAPTTAPAPVEIPTPVYGLPSLPASGAVPGLSYGAAFAPMANPMANPYINPTDIFGAYPYINLMDIFGAYPDFLPRA